MPHAVDLHRFWTIPGTVSQAVNWMQSHQPANLGISSTSGAESGQSQGGRRAGRPAGIELWSATYGFTTAPAGVTSQQLEVALVPAKGGGVAMRADAEAGFLLPRPAPQQLPAGTDRVRVHVSVTRRSTASSSSRSSAGSRSQRGALRVPRTYDITSRERIGELVGLMNTMPAAQQSQRACLNNAAASSRRPGPSLAIGLTFTSAGASSPLAVAAIDARCDVVRLKIGARPEQDLTLNFPGYQASRYAWLIDGLATGFAPPFGGAASGRAGSSSSGLQGETAPPVRAP
jgi:hypothetical protein